MRDGRPKDQRQATENAGRLVAWMRDGSRVLAGPEDTRLSPRVLAALVGAVLVGVAVGATAGSASAASETNASVQKVEERLEVPPPPFSDGIFPCMNCHANQKPNRTRRTLTDMHTDIELKHAQHLWCLDCHDADNRNTLHLASGEPVPFEESYRLCGQCHGEKLRDWKAGVHGRRTGNWNGSKGYLLCVHCHRDRKSVV